MLYKNIAIKHELFHGKDIQSSLSSRFVLDSSRLLDLLNFVANGNDLSKRKYIFDFRQGIVAIGMTGDKERHENIAYDCIRRYVDFHIYGGYIEVSFYGNEVHIELSGSSAHFDKHVGIKDLRERRLAVAKHIQSLLGSIKSMIEFQGYIAVVVVQKKDIKIPS